MPETHYIEIDEEIISTVGRLRKSGQAENIFVFPKRALILQSIINLKLLAREAEKLGKHIIVMSQDEQGVRLAEKAGLRIQDYQDLSLRESRAEETERFTVRHGENIPMPVSADPNVRRRSDEIGTSSFFGEHERTLTPLPAAPVPIRTQHTAPIPLALPAPQALPSQPQPQTLRVRNMNPVVQTSLNSKRGVSPMNPQPLPVVQQQPVRPPVASEYQAPKNGSPSMAERKEKLRRLFQPDPARDLPRQAVPATAAIRNESYQGEPESLGRPQSNSSKRGWLFPIAGGVLVLGVVVFGFFFLRPTAIVAIEAQTAEQSVKLSLVGTADGLGSGNAVLARYIEVEKTVHITRDATGQETGNAAKSSGTIIISNDFSTASQPLVATTRFEASDGKIYRLVDGVTVPGAKSEGGKQVPGSIEAKVIADAPGEAYNKPPSDFTIPGFKGSPKFDKIKGRSAQAFVGGSSTAGSSATSVSTGDLAQAQEQAAEEAKKNVVADLSQSLKEGEVALLPSFQTALVGVPTAPAAGVPAKSFDYEARFLVKGFVISEKDVRAVIDQETAESAGVTLRPAEYTVEYGAVLPNFETKRVDLSVQSKVLFRAPLDEAVIKEKLLGLDEDGIRAFLGEHPEIKRLQVEFKPKVFIATIPNDPERVEVTFDAPEN